MEWQQQAEELTYIFELYAFSCNPLCILIKLNNEGMQRFELHKNLSYKNTQSQNSTLTQRL